MFHPGDIATLAQRFLGITRRSAFAPAAGPAVLPLVEIDLFTMTTADAFERAGGGNTPAGLGLLQAGLQRAEAARATGEPWAAELVSRYEEVRDHFMARHAVP